MDTIQPTPTPAPGPKLDTHSYKGWLNSDSFIKRSIAIWGYFMVTNIVVSIIVAIPFFLIFGFLISSAIHNMPMQSSSDIPRQIHGGKNMQYYEDEQVPGMMNETSPKQLPVKQ